ncbi:hypothetical protein L218DRAFT_1081345 [Marasmius fiardii PR-910]|nr:hypothetical protein L218DRAFT_1081345 [Marasmius fiardii PR-910]
MPSVAKVPLSTEVSVPAENLLATLRSLFFNPFVLITGLLLGLTVVLRKFVLPILSLTTLERRVQELDEFLADAERHYIPTESSHRNALSELEEKVSALKRKGYKIQHSKHWTSTEYLLFFLYTRPRNTFRYYFILRRTRLRAMAEVEGEKQAFNEFMRTRRRGLIWLEMPDHERRED